MGSRKKLPADVSCTTVVFHASNHLQGGTYREPPFQATLFRPYTLSTKVAKMNVKGGICASYTFEKCNLAKCYFLKYTLSTKVAKMEVKGVIYASYTFEKCNSAKCYF